MENNHSCMIYTSDQWKSTSNIGRIISLGTLCIELFNDYSIKLKIGNGKLTFQYLPYIPDMSMYYSKTEIDGFNKIINDKINEIKNSLTYIDSRVTNLEGVAHTHDNKNILDKIEEPFTTSDKEKLDSLEPYDDSEIKNDIIYLKERSHTHDNKEILDKTTASFTTEYEWMITHGVTYDVFKPATSKEDGDIGLVPAPKKGDQNKFLRGDGTWTKVDPGETLTPATATHLGGVKIGNGINVTTDGTISIDEYNIPIATTTTLGGVIVGDGLSVDSNGVISTDSQSSTEYQAGDAIEIYSESISPEYKHVEYIETYSDTVSGFSYIDTGYIPKPNADIELTIAPSTGSQTFTPVCITRLDGQSSTSNVFGVAWNSTTGTGIWFNRADYTTGFGGQYVELSSNIRNKKTTFKTIGNALYIYDEDNNQLGYVTNPNAFTLDSPFSLPIFASKIHSNDIYANDYMYGKFYEMYVRENGKIVNHFIPCKTVDQSPTIVGIYDTITRRFYQINKYGAGGEVRIGPEISDETFETKINVLYADGLSINANNQLINTGLLDAYVEDGNLHITR